MAIIKYVIADDHKIFRQGLKLTLNSDYRLKLIGEAANGRELLHLLEKQVPDAILLDLKMPEIDGFQAMIQIREKYPSVKILVLTMHDDEQFILHLMENGANGYLLKNTEPNEILVALHTVCEKGFYFNDLVSATLLKRVLQKTPASENIQDEVNLTQKEIDVLKLICDEHTAPEIAKEIFLSQRTVEGIRSALLEKTGCRNTAGLVLFAVKHGIYVIK